MTRIPGFVINVAEVAVVAGAAGSLALMLRAGHPPFLLRLMFAVWVLSPFAALVLASRMSKAWSDPTRAALCLLMLVVTIGSLAIYGGLVPAPPGTKPAALYLLVPLASWLLLVTLVPLAARLSRRL